MRITRLLLRNYRVYEDQLELEIPPGLVGIYGPNGAGKSYLIESILWTLFGRARTTKTEVRTAGVNAECITEVEFEHEGHLYVVRRTISGSTHAVGAQAHADHLHVAEGPRDTARYVRSVLGMDDAAFRASVFAEQKQLAAFSATAPDRRRQLVLKLLGITPLDAARDLARRDARTAHGDVERLRALLPDLNALAAAYDATRTAAAEAEDGARQTAAEAETRRHQEAEARQRYDEATARAADYDVVVVEGREARQRHEQAAQRVAELTDELAGLARVRSELGEIEPQVSGLAELEARLRAAQEVASARHRLAALVVPPEPPEPDEEGWEEARAETEKARSALATHDALATQADQDRRQAAQLLRRSSELSGEAECPLCGQSLGAAAQQVQAHRTAEHAEAEARLAALQRQRAELTQSVEAAAQRVERATQALRRAREARLGWEQARARRQEAQEALNRAAAVLSPPYRSGEEAELAAEVERGRKAAALYQRLRGRLERGPKAEAELEIQRQRRDDAAGRLDVLREKIASLRHCPEALAAARADLAAARAAAAEATEVAQAARVAAARAQSEAEAAAGALAAANDQHARLADLVEQARHLGRLAELLASFRNEMVGAVGPRLSCQAAELFAELTDGEYDELQVDPDTYEIQILDQGMPYGMDRFSGSEIDLANLALRIAISEHVRFQSGGQVGLVVLDEVFGPLDPDRKDRMLRALERLRARFRQVLVVTHDAEIKEQLPSAIEVVKLAGRRATARVINR